MPHSIYLLCLIYFFFFLEEHGDGHLVLSSYSNRHLVEIMTVWTLETRWDKCNSEDHLISQRGNGRTNFNIKIK